MYIDNRFGLKAELFDFQLTENLSASFCKEKWIKGIILRKKTTNIFGPCH